MSTAEEQIWNGLRDYIRDGTPISLDFPSIARSMHNPQFVFEGEGYNATVDSNIAEFISDFQYNLLRSYAILKYDVADVRRLTKEDKEHLKVTFSVHKGSSELEAQLTKILTESIPQMLEKITGDQLTMLLAMLIVGYFGKVYFKAFLKHKAQLRNIQSIAEKDESETERLQIFNRLAESLHKAAVIKSDIDGSFDSALRAVAKCDSGTIHGVNISGTEARILTETDREKATQTRLDGKYRVHKLDSSREEGHKFQVRSQDNGEEFITYVERSLMPPEDFDEIVSAVVNKNIIGLNINGQRLHGRIIEAYIVGVQPKNKLESI